MLQKTIATRQHSRVMPQHNRILRKQPREATVSTTANEAQTTRLTVGSAIEFGKVKATNKTAQIICMVCAASTQVPFTVRGVVKWKIAKDNRVPMIGHPFKKQYDPHFGSSVAYPRVGRGEVSCSANRCKQLIRHCL